MGKYNVIVNIKEPGNKILNHSRPLLKLYQSDNRASAYIISAELHNSYSHSYYNNLGVHIAYTKRTYQYISNNNL